MTELELVLANEAATEELGAAIAHALAAGAVVYLEGPLGAGKTTLVRGLLRALGHTGAVKSPTYTLVEPYRLQGLVLHHFDLYRLADAEELEYIGIRDYFTEQSVCLIEWPSCGEGALPPADLHLTLGVATTGRAAFLRANTARGQALLAKLNAT